MNWSYVKSQRLFLQPGEEVYCIQEQGKCYIKELLKKALFAW